MDELPPGEEWRRRPGVVRQGARFGGISCVGCLTFVVLLAVVLAVVLVAIGHHAH